MGVGADATARTRAGESVAPHAAKRRMVRRCTRFLFSTPPTKQPPFLNVLIATVASGLLRLQKGPFGAFENEGGERAAGERAGIDADAVALHIGPRGDGVAVHDDLAVLRLGLEKLVANPQQIFFDLLLERNARTNAGVNEEVVAFAMRQGQARHEAAVALGQALGEVALDADQVLAPRRVRRAHAVAQERRGPAIGEPGGADRVIDEKAQHAVL